MITQADIAKRLGISQAAVASVLGNCARRNALNAELRDKVEKTAQDLGYRPHRYAQILRKRQSGLLGALYFGGVTGIAAPRAMAVAQAIHASGYRLLMSDSGWYDENVLAACAEMIDSRVEGILLVGPSHWMPKKALDMIHEAGIPVAAMSGVRLPGVSQVTGDAKGGMALLTRHLAAMEHKRLAILGAWPTTVHNDDQCWPTLNRLRGFEETIRDLGGEITKTIPAKKSKQRLTGTVILSNTDVKANNPYELGFSMTSELLTRGPIPDALLCSNDDWAHGALAACSKYSIRVPQDMALTGFDNVPLSEYGSVPLTTIAQPLDEMAKASVQLLLDEISGKTKNKKAVRLEMPCRLVIRRSCGSYPQESKYPAVPKLQIPPLQD